jgi:hypothetical protein
MNRGAIWYVTKRDESRPAIVTLGFPTHASDLFYVRGIHKTGHEGWNSCYTDTSTCVGLARLVEGGISSIEDLEAAENALQVLMWHDRVDVMIPAFKFRGDGLASYARCEEPRSDLAFSLFLPCQPYDVIFAVEEVEVQGSQITASNLGGSPIVGLSFGDAVRSYAAAPAQLAALCAMPTHIECPRISQRSRPRTGCGETIIFRRFLRNDSQRLGRIRVRHTGSRLQCAPAPTHCDRP